MSAISDTIDSIENKEMEIAKIKESMEEISQNIIEEMLTYIPNELNRFVETTISEQPELVVNMHDDKLKDMKSAIEDLMQQLPRLIKDEASNGKIWLHRKEPDLGIANHSRTLMNADIDKRIFKQFKKPIACAHDIFNKYGLRQSNDGIYIQWSESVRRHVLSYRNTNVKYENAYFDRAKLLKKKHTLEAMKLWKEV